MNISKVISSATSIPQLRDEKYIQSLQLALWLWRCSASAPPEEVPPFVGLNFVQFFCLSVLFISASSHRFVYYLQNIPKLNISNALNRFAFSQDLFHNNLHNVPFIEKEVMRLDMYKAVPFSQVDIDGGFWKDRQQLNRKTTIYAVMDRFKQTGRFEAFHFGWKEGMPNRPHIFWDSDVAKWIESAAYILQKHEDRILEAECDQLIDLIGEHQDKTGYFNIYFTVVEPDQRFKRRTDHELYCAGHLIEAAVAYHKSTAKDKFLNIMRRYADYIYQVFYVENSAAFETPGHEEIELALIKLYEHTKDEKYLELSKCFVDRRGSSQRDVFYGFANAKYTQDHLPVRSQSTAEGHAVRAVYLYSAMADLARIGDDAELQKACMRLFSNIINKRMYITGGIGSAKTGEAFTVDYDLPNLTAYSESCAAIGLALFARRMLLLEPVSAYADVIERVLYNGFLSTVSIDGKSFFYENPLQIRPELVKRDASVGSGGSQLPPTQRSEVFDCSCCPPNITRFMATIGDFIYTHSDDTLFIHQYINSRSVFEVGGSRVTICQSTDYPSGGIVDISVNGMPAQGGTVALRIPYWCNEFTIIKGGEKQKCPVREGYAYVTGVISSFIRIEFVIKPQLIAASPYVQENSGRVALQRGPVVYCLEAVDNGELLADVVIDKKLNTKTGFNAMLNVETIICKGYRRRASKMLPLYYESTDDLHETELTFIPYYAFANRGESEMIVWVQKN